MRAGAAGRVGVFDVAPPTARLAIIFARIATGALALCSRRRRRRRQTDGNAPDRAAIRHGGDVVSVSEGVGAGRRGRAKRPSVSSSCVANSFILHDFV